SLFKKGVRSGGNWQIFGWNLYYVSKANKRKTWHDAENFCMSRDSHLTSILNEEEQKYISSQLSESAWIGLTDENEEGHWEWSDGSRLTIQYWADGNPDGSTNDGEGDKDCTFIESSASEFNWNDASCQELRRWVCKENLEFEER
ncbi:C-type lectin domain family 4 member F-like, partial [Python bivittatus]|uniref:C-type lectin domain family 4 member F-like n=1 Tax=Python bivittatus TaxID=176946 RepID=A0A9F5JDC4_PYTBI